MKLLRRTLTVAAASVVVGGVAAAMIVLAAPQDSQIEFSSIREKQYVELADITRDSSIVALVTITDGEVSTAWDSSGQSGPPTVTFPAEVTELLAEPGAFKLPAGEPPVVGDSISIVQFGYPESLDGPWLEPGVTYLLFLRPTLIAGSSSLDFLVTGATAGIYRQEADGTFTFVEPRGDLLPQKLTLDELRAVLG